jgi:hypothetical protein
MTSEAKTSGTDLAICLFLQSAILRRRPFALNQQLGKVLSAAVVRGRAFQASYVNDLAPRCAAFLKLLCIFMQISIYETSI